MSHKNIYNVIICGVGGQGVITSAEILSDYLLTLDYEVRKSDLHGLAQRGGSVMSSVRFGSNVLSPVIPSGKTDYLLALDPFELKKYQPELSESGLSIDISEQEHLLISNSRTLNIVLLAKWIMLVSGDDNNSHLAGVSKESFINWIKNNLPGKILQANLDSLSKINFL